MAEVRGAGNALDRSLAPMIVLLRSMIKYVDNTDSPVIEVRKQIMFSIARSQDRHCTQDVSMP